MADVVKDFNSRILVSGDVCGKFKLLFKRITSIIEKSGPFSMLLCVGEFFGEEEEWSLYKSGTLKAPIATYILGPVNEKNKSCYSDMKGCELAENIIYLGTNGIYTCNNGLKIAYLSGNDPKLSDSSDLSLMFGLDAIKSLEITAGSKPKIDILISSEWPKGICSYVKGPDGFDTSNIGSLLVSRLVVKLKPRYHFVGTQNVFYERLPYRNHEVLKEAAHHVTRFISLAKVGNPSKEKWLYAFNTMPIKHLPVSELNCQPPDVTEHPYSKEIIGQTEKIYSRKASSNQSQFFFDMNSKQDNSDRSGKKRIKENDYDQSSKRPQKSNAPCWFCLASPEVEKHLVVSVGSSSYLALAKGGLVPDHLLILPIEHFQSTTSIEDECKSEIEKFKLSLKEMFENVGKTVIFFERNYKSQHLQVQVVPLPLKFYSYLKESFLNVCEDKGINLDELPKYSDIAQLAPPGTPFFYVELPTGEKLFHRIRKGFPLQFGRELLCCPPLLNAPERIDWRDCKLSKDEEVHMRNSIRASFKPYDFTLEEESDSDAGSDSKSD